MTWLDGKKRYLILAVFVVQALAQLLGRGRDIVDVTRYLIGHLGLTPSDGFVQVLIICQILASSWAIYDGWRKDREQRLRLIR